MMRMRMMMMSQTQNLSSGISVSFFVNQYFDLDSVGLHAAD